MSQSAHSTLLVNKPQHDAVPGKRPRHALLLRLAVLAVALLLSLVLAELAVRLFAPQHPAWLDIYANTPGMPVYGLQPDVSRTVDNGETRWTVMTDSRGFRRGADHHPDAAAPVILIVGDSFAFGLGVNYEQSIPGLLQSQLGPSHQVVSTAVPGYGPTHYRRILEYELTHGVNPEMVIVCTYMGNDFHDCVVSDDIVVKNGLLGNYDSFRSQLKLHLHLYRLISRAYHGSHAHATVGESNSAVLYDPHGWETGILGQALPIYRREFADIQTLCAARRIPLLVCIIPTNESVEHLAAAQTQSSCAAPQYDLPARRAADIMAASHIRCIDLTDTLRRAGVKNAYFNWDPHLSPLGNKLAAGAILPLYRERRAHDD